MLGPVEGLKVLIEVDAAKAQAVLREFSGSVALAGAAASNGLSPAEQRMNQFLDTIGDTRRRAEELEVSMRNMAAGSNQAATGFGTAGSALRLMGAAAAGFIALGVGKFLWDAAMSTDEMKEASASLSQAMTELKPKIGAAVNEMFLFDEVTRAAAGAIALLNEASKSSGLGGRDLAAEARDKAFIPSLLRELGEYAPKPIRYSEAPSLLSDDARAFERMFKELEKGVATNHRLRDSTREVKQELTALEEALQSWVRTQVRAQAQVDLYKMLGLDEDGKFPMLETSSFGMDSLVLSVDQLAESTSRLGQIAPVAFRDFTAGIETAAGAAVTLGEYVRGTFEQFEQAMYQAAGTALYAAISGEQSTKKVLKALLNSIGVEAATQAIMEAAKAIAAYASYDYYAGSLHAKAAGMFLGVAAVAGVASRAIDTSSSGGGGKGKGGKDFAPAPAILPPERQAQITIIIDGNVIGQEEYVRQLALEAARQMKKAGA